MQKQRLLSLRRRIIEKDFSRLNDRQFEAVTTVQGPLLILAGAGSGKTTVIVNRIAALIKYGNAYNSEEIFTADPDAAAAAMERYLNGDASALPQIRYALSEDAPKPWEILAITFTNKAANELKARLVSMLGEEGDEIWASTFHSACVRILRREAGHTGYSAHFTIYDTDDSKRVIRDCQRQLGIDEKVLPASAILAEISRAKDNLLSPEEYARGGAGRDPRLADVSRVYALYEKALRAADAMDFDDIIVNTVALLRENDEVRAHYQRRFRYIMVDEYQDTNHAQYVLVSLLAGAHRNLCVVGDDDQSIYSFRGANIENILSFEEQFSNAVVIRLEENYRSTGRILQAANAVIAHNRARKGKELWTANGEGERLELRTCADEQAEAAYVADRIMDAAADGAGFSDFAVLYRTNAQSAAVERALVRAGVPYRVIGGHRFYDRKEIKDALAYLAVISNPSDNVRLRRIVNEPKRGIGETTLNNLAEVAAALGQSMFEVMKESAQYHAFARSSAKLTLFCEMIGHFIECRETLSLPELFRTVMNETGYIQSLALDEATREERTENLDELYSVLARYEEENGPAASLEGFLEEVALLSDIDNYDSGLETVTLMTLHSAKGLEFPVVFLVGMEEGLFPSARSLGDENQLEEERRLCYVGITRAKRRLYLTRAFSRMQYGRTVMNPPSCFLDELPPEVCRDTSPASYARGGGFAGYAKNGYGGGYGGGYGYGGRAQNAGSRKPRGGAEDLFAPPKKDTTAPPDLRTGDTVLHKKFGKGLVVSAQPLGNDLLVEVAFESCGTKRLMAKVAAMKKL